MNRICLFIYNLSYPLHTTRYLDVSPTCPHIYINKRTHQNILFNLDSFSFVHSNTSEASTSSLDVKREKYKRLRRILYSDVYRLPLLNLLERRVFLPMTEDTNENTRDIRLIIECHTSKYDEILLALEYMHIR
jgi:hypothetical protein